MRKVWVYIILFILSWNRSSAQYNLSVWVNTKPFPTANEVLYIYINGVREFIGNNSSAPNNSQLFQKKYTNPISSVVAYYGTSSATINYAAGSSGGWAVMPTVSAGIYASGYQYFKVYYKNLLTEPITIYKTGIPVREGANFCATDTITIVHNEFEIAPGLNEHQFKILDGINVNSSLLGFDTRSINGHENGYNYWPLVIPPSLASISQKRSFQARYKYNVNSVETFSGWSTVSNAVNIYHAPPRISILSTYSNCLGESNFVLSISGLIGGNSGITGYKIRLYPYTVGNSGQKNLDGATLMNGLDSTVTANGIYTITQNNVFYKHKYGIPPCRYRIG